MNHHLFLNQTPPLLGHWPKYGCFFYPHALREEHGSTDGLFLLLFLFLFLHTSSFWMQRQPVSHMRSCVTRCHCDDTKYNTPKNKSILLYFYSLPVPRAQNYEIHFLKSCQFCPDTSRPLAQTDPN